MEHEVLKAKKSNGTTVALLKTSGKYTPYVVAWCYDELEKTWGQGHYFRNFEDALRYYEENY